MTEKIVKKSLNLTLDLPLQWTEKIEQLALEKQQPLSELITDIIGVYLSYNLDELNISRLQENYQELNKKVQILEAKDHYIDRLEHRLFIIEKLVSSLQTQISPYPRDKSISYAPIIEEEFEDEPDEILTDFLE
ncbi:MAG: hypothetical protein GW795_06260 [Cyanobacteria bacterium]|nr:hypothetical protein [Cyanobacteria bacterium CG_2015-16_32_12]NCO77658.1 hypothetical protein [Cyanobacteria bacterium CG_2015-22_32_23]NCQ04110.1 hypothetical protein [Cyanobacteria bacterium CG_2015-09_32_10]NCQ41489.1 hypothetical protein [Cyanobacteria bacterium CG_2015-04_32_10]NCS85925.1 hypothetical protein [Cyanobacteria bacterium CG_2015-02_32_10]